jgi:hypothetical protein
MDGTIRCVLQAVNLSSSNQKRAHQKSINATPAPFGEGMMPSVSPLETAH